MSERAPRAKKQDNIVALLLGLPLFAVGSYLFLVPWLSAPAGFLHPGVFAIRLLMAAPFALLAAYGASLSLRYLAPAWIAIFTDRFWWLRGVAALALGVPIVVGAVMEAVIQRDPRVLAGPLIFAGLGLAGAFDLLRQRRRRQGPQRPRK